MKKNEIDPRAKAILEDYEARAEARKELERRWLVCANYFAGNQYAEILPTGAIGRMEKKYPWQLTSVYNHIAPIIESRLAKFNRMKGEVTCLPASEETSDAAAARLATKLIGIAKENGDFTALARQCAFWAEICGTAFYKVVWSKNAGARIGDRYEGDVEISVCPPYEIYPDDLTATDVKDCRSILHVKAYPAEAVEEVWGIKPKGKTAVMSYGKGGVLSEEKEGYVPVIEKYVRPTAAYPKGRLTVVAGTEVLYDGDLPFCDERGEKRGFPFVRQVAIPAPSSFFGTGLVERMIPIQRDYNEIKNRKHEYVNRMTAGVLLCEDGSVDLDELEEEGIAPGKVIVYRQGCEAPQTVNFGSIPSDFAEEEDRLLKEFVSVSGVSDFLLTGAATDRSNYSGTALSIITEQNNNRLCVTTESIKNATREVAGKILALYKRYATKEMLARIADTPTIECEAFLNGSLGAENVVFDLDEAQVDTVADKRGLARVIFDMALLADENGHLDGESKRSLLKLLGCEGMASTRTTDGLHRKKAQEENERAGAIGLPATYDDHSVHLYEHTRFVLERETTLGEDEINNVGEHIAAHRAMLADK